MASKKELLALAGNAFGERSARFALPRNSWAYFQKSTCHHLPHHALAPHPLAIPSCT
jgi:hypothetical protein